MIHLEYFLILSALMFFIGIYGFLTRRSTLAVLFLCLVLYCYFCCRNCYSHSNNDCYLPQRKKHSTQAHKYLEMVGIINQ